VGPTVSRIRQCGGVVTASMRSGNGFVITWFVVD